MSTQLKLAAYLAHVRRATGSWPSDWAFAWLALNEARRVLHRYLTDARLPHSLTVKAYAASEDLRTDPRRTTNWQLLQAQVIRVVPVVQHLLHTLATPSSAA